MVPYSLRITLCSSIEALVFRIALVSEPYHGSVTMATSVVGCLELVQENKELNNNWTLWMTSQFLMGIMVSIVSNVTMHRVSLG